MKLRRLLKPLALATALFTLAAVPALGYNPTARYSQRDRAGASTWAPRSVEASTYFTGGHAWISVAFDWYQPQHMLDLEETEQGFEIGLDIPCGYAGLADNLPVGQGYVGGGWATNMPGSAFPYEDTIYNDNCADGYIRFGVGVAAASVLSYGSHYYAYAELDTQANWTPTGGNVGVVVKTGTLYDSEITGEPLDNSDCSWNSSEIAAWNTPSAAGLQLRLEASWCNFSDWVHTVVRDTSNDLYTGQDKTFNTDKLTNQGFEETTCSGYGCYSVSSGNGVARYCNDAVTPAFDGSCYVTFNRGSNGSIATLQQDVPDPLGGTWTTGYYTAEAAVRCRSGQGVSQCPLTMSYHGIWNSTESYGVSTAIPADNHWYICRADTDHRDADNIFTTHHDLLRWQLWNNTTSASLDVDYTFLGGKTKQHDIGGSWAGGDLDQTAYGVGPACTQVG